MRNQIKMILFSIVMACLLSGCAAARLAPEHEASVKSVAVVSLVQEQTRVSHLGVTVFNNHAAVVDQSGLLNKEAISVIERHLQAARPAWTIRHPVVDWSALSEKNRKAGTAWGDFTGNITEDLKTIARNADADLLFVVLDWKMENSPGTGIGVITRAFTSGSKGSALVHAHVALALVDRQGKELTRRGGGNVTVPMDQLGLNYDLSSLSDPAVKQKVMQAMQDQLEKVLNDDMGGLGY